MEKQKLSLEEALSLKKAEMPSQSDWQKFDAELKSKMLLSMIEREPRYKAVLRHVVALRPVRSFGLAGLALLCALAIPFAITHLTQGLKTGAHSSQFAEFESIPNVQGTFVTNIVSASSSEDFVSARINSSSNLAENFVNSGISSVGSITF